MNGPEGMYFGGIIRGVRTPRPLAVSLSSETRQIGVYLHRNGLSKNGISYGPDRIRTMCAGLFIVAVTGVGGADVFLRDGSGGVGGRYAYKTT